MSIEVTGAEKEAAKIWIVSFLESKAGLEYKDIESLPKRPYSIHCSKDEVNGVCRFFAFEYLRDSGAPEIVSTTIAHLVTLKIRTLDLTSFEDISTATKDSEDEDEQDEEPKTITVYDCGKLAVVTVNAVHEICKEWKEKMPPLLKSRNLYEVYSHCEQNTRRRMEDKDIVITEFNNLFGLDKDFPSQAFFAVFDGHGGIDCANYTVAHFHNNIASSSSFSSDLDEALRQAFLTTDKMFLEKARHENLRAGTTGVVAMIRDNTLHIGWLGDSQVSMCKQGRAVQLMEPHKPNRKDERKRIEELGGCVLWIGDWRVNGNIAVSRSIGDKDHKPYVSADPDTLEFDLEGDEEYLILGCDGLWDTIPAPDVIAMVEEYLSTNGARSELPKFLVNKAISHGSTDNVTVIVVFLDYHKKPGQPAAEEAPETAAESTTKETGVEKVGDKQSSH